MSAAVAARIDLFNAVRDIPYGYNLANRAKDATCLTKAERLGLRLKMIGIESRMVCCHFKWAESGLPPALLAEAPGVESKHFYRQVEIPETGQWVDVDPTFDSGLKEAGFAVAEWDGLHPTILGVKPTVTFSLADSKRISDDIKNIPLEDWQEMQLCYGPFYDGLNQWIAAQRHVPTRSPIKVSSLKEAHA